MKHKLIFLAGVGAAAGAFALAWFGRRAVVGQLAERYGDQEAADVASSLTFTEALAAGARSIVGSTPIGEREIFVVS